MSGNYYYCTKCHSHHPPTDSYIGVGNDPLVEGVWFKSLISGVLYRNHLSVGEIESVIINGVYFNQTPCHNSKSGV